MKYADMILLFLKNLVRVISFPYLYMLRFLQHITTIKPIQNTYFFHERLN